MDNLSIFLSILCSGTVLLITGVVIYFLIKWRNAKDGKIIAEKYNENLDKQLSTPRKLIKVGPEDVEAIDKDFFDQINSWATKKEYTYLGDYRDLRVETLQPNLVSAMRVFVNHDGTISLTCARYRARGPMRLLQLIGLFRADDKLKFIVFISELNNDTFIRSSNTEETDYQSYPPEVVNNKHTWCIHLEQLLESHCTHLNIALKSAEEVQPKQIATVDEFDKTLSKFDKLLYEYRMDNLEVRLNDLSALLERTRGGNKLLREVVLEETRSIFERRQARRSD